MPWVIDEKHSNVGFAITHMMFIPVRGRFHRYRGAIDLNEQDLTRSHFSGEIDVASIDTRVAQRDDHLRSPEFFDAARYPTIRYESTRIEALGSNRFRVYGHLTIRDITREVVVEGEYTGGAARDPWGVLRTGFSATGTLIRQDFGLVWNIGLAGGGAFIGDTVTVQLDIELMWQETPMTEPTAQVPPPPAMG